MAKPSIKSNLIDGNSTKRFASIEKAAEWVRSMEDFGEDGRRSWGFQGEFGTHEFVGFNWADVKAVWRASVEVMIVDCPEWNCFEWDYAFGESRQMWARRQSVRITSEPDSTNCRSVTEYDVKSVQGRFEVGFVEYAGPDDFATTTIGVYRSMEAAVNACRRHYAAPKAEPSFVNDAFWSDIAAKRAAAELATADQSGIPF